MNTEILRDEFLTKVFEKINQQVMTRLNFRGLSANYCGNVVELPISTIKGCHYEIGFHADCHEIALHFQGTAENNRSRSEGFRAHLPRLESILEYRLILGPHERADRRRLWIKLPVNPLTSELVEKYSELTAQFIIATLPVLQAVIDQERRARYE